MWAVEMSESTRDDYVTSHWPLSKYAVKLICFFEELDERDSGKEGNLIGEGKEELIELLRSQYDNPGISYATKIYRKEKDTVWIHNQGDVSCVFILETPSYTGPDFKSLLEIAPLVGKIFVEKEVIPKEFQPKKNEATSVFEGTFGCERIAGDQHYLFWCDPSRALRLAKMRYKRGAGLITYKKRKDCYQLLMRCLKTIVNELLGALTIPKSISAVIDSTDYKVQVVCGRAKYKNDPLDAMEVILQFPAAFKILDPAGIKRIGKKSTYWSFKRRPEEPTYAQALQILLKNRDRFKACIQRYFKVDQKFNRFFRWVEQELKKRSKT